MVPSAMRETVRPVRPKRVVGIVMFEVPLSALFGNNAAAYA